MMFLRMTIFLIASVLSVSASAVTLNTLIAGADPIADDGAQLFSLTDVDGVNDDSNSFIFLENAGYKNQNSFGLYDIDDPTNRLTAFLGSDAVGDSTTLHYLGAGQWQSDYNAVTFGSGSMFGVYLDSPDGLFYSQALLNADGFDHFLTFPTFGSSGLPGVFDYVFGIEDLYGGGDEDYNDFVVGVTDVAPKEITTTSVPVPETAPLVAAGLAALGLVAMRRKKKNGPMA